MKRAARGAGFQKARRQERGIRAVFVLQTIRDTR
jgi:hypothetical protein